MADYEDQNSSEYKDMNQETPAADQNPHSAGNVPQNPNPAQPDQQNPPQNDGQIPPQNSGQNPYWQNQQNGGQMCIRDRTAAVQLLMANCPHSLAASSSSSDMMPVPFTSTTAMIIHAYVGITGTNLCKIAPS